VAGDNLGTQSEGNVHYWKPLPSNGRENVAVDTSVCVTVYFKTSCYVSKSPINLFYRSKPSL
jgi:hypothetical protein